MLISTLDSLQAVTSARAWFLPVGWLLRSSFPSAERLRGTEVPALVAHADDDGVVPYARGRALAAALPVATFVTIDDAQHGALTITSPAVAAAWAVFVDRVAH